MSPSQATQRRTRRLPAAIVVVAGIGVLLLSIVTAISFGPSDLSVGNVWDVLAHKLGFGPDPGLTPLRVATIWDLRLPRVLLAAAAGAGLSLCGVIMQSLLRNPLAEPYLLGVSSGASTGAVLILVMGLGGGLVSFPAAPSSVLWRPSPRRWDCPAWRAAPPTRSCWQASPSLRGSRP